MTGHGGRRASAAHFVAVVILIATPHRIAAQIADEQQARKDQDPIIIVTGSRLPRTNHDDPGPIQVLTEADLATSALPNLEQTLNQLPQLVGGFTSTSNNPGTGGATLDLRGLGSTRTLVLVNGRRWIASDAGQVPEVDINTIPAALVERVDVVTGGASTVYGSDAVTGVVNFVLRDRIDGIHLHARQSVTARGDGAVSSADLVTGTELLGDRLRLTAAVGWLEQRSVLQGDRILSEVALTDQCGVPGTRQSNGASQPLPANACPTQGEITLVAGGSPTIAGSRIIGAAFFPGAEGALMANPLGLRFDPDGAPRPFMIPADLYNFAPDNYLQVPFRRYSAVVRAYLDLGRGIEPYVDFAFVDTLSRQQLAPVPAVLGGGGTVPVARINLANPFLTAAAREVLDTSYGIGASGERGFLRPPGSAPIRNPAFFGDADGVIALPAIIATRLDLGPRQVAHGRQAYRGMIGARGGSRDGWDYDAYVSHSRVVHGADYRNSGSASRLQQALLVVRDPITGQPVCLDPSGGCVPANIFGAGNLSPAAADFLRTNPRERTVVEETVAEASLTGSLALGDLQPMRIAMGITWRRTAYRFSPDPALTTGDDLGFLPGASARGATRAIEAFAESRIEIAENFFAELGVRVSGYRGAGTALTYKAVGNWEPVQGLRLRGGHQRAVRAPNVRELFEAPVTSFGGIVDPCDPIHGRLDQPAIRDACLRNGVPAEILGDPLVGSSLVTTSGNPGLRPELARTWTIGAVLSAGPEGPNLAVDFYDIDISQPIGVFGGGAIATVLGCIAGGGDPSEPLCAQFTRRADGSIANLDLPTANNALLSARGIDWQAAATFPLHDASALRLSLSLAGTYYLHSGFRVNRALPYVDCAGLFGGVCGNTIGGTALPRWKLLNTAELALGSIKLSLRHRWFSATEDSRTSFTQALGLSPPVLPKEGRRLEARHYLDLAGTMRFGEGRSLVLGVSNLLDTSPALTGTLQVQANTDPSLYDVLGRRFFVAIQTSF